MRDEAKIKFYRTPAVHSVIKRYEMTDDQKSVIYAAIATAKRDKPNMRLIEKADALLQELNRTQKPKITQKLSKKEQAKVAFASQHIESESKKERTSEAPLFLRPYVIGPIIGMLIGSVIYYSMGTVDEKHNHRYTYDEARQHCNEKNMVLPLLTSDVPPAPYFEHSNVGFWAADGNIIYNREQALIRGFEKAVPKAGEKYHAICLDENNITGETMFISIKTQTTKSV